MFEDEVQNTDPLVQQMAQQKQNQLAQDDDPYLTAMMRLLEQGPSEPAPMNERDKQKQGLALTMMLAGGGRGDSFGRVGQQLYSGQQEEREAQRKRAELDWQRQLKGNEFGLGRSDQARAAQIDKDRWEKEFELKSRPAKEPNDSWSMIADPVRGGMIMFNKITGETRPMSGDAGAEMPVTNLPAYKNMPTGLKIGTEAEQKSFSFANRLAEAIPAAEEIILSGQYHPTQKDIMLKATSGQYPTLAAAIEKGISEEGRKYLSTVAPIVNAILRKESGAAITTDEWTRAFSDWLPRPTDSPEMVLVKLGRMRDEMNSLAASSGAAARYYVEPPRGWDTGTNAAPAAGATGEPREGDSYLDRVTTGGAT